VPCRLTHRIRSSWTPGILSLPLHNRRPWKTENQFIHIRSKNLLAWTSTSRLLSRGSLNRKERPDHSLPELHLLILNITKSLKQPQKCGTEETPTFQPRRLARPNLRQSCRHEAVSMRNTTRARRWKRAFYPCPSPKRTHHVLCRDGIWPSDVSRRCAHWSCLFTGACRVQCWSTRPYPRHCPLRLM
jgi:hypothetical protein